MQTGQGESKPDKSVNQLGELIKEIESLRKQFSTAKERVELLEERIALACDSVFGPMPGFKK